jgi:hypothetical protein
MDWGHDRVGLRRQEAEEFVLAVDRKANQMGVVFRFVSTHSQNDVAGTMQRLSKPDHRRRCGFFTFPMFVTGRPPNC